METYRLHEPIRVFGIHVNSFPAGIPEAFNSLAQVLPQGYDRPYYGISWMAGDNVVYHATTAEIIRNEADQYAYESHTIEQGPYAVVTVTGWRKKTGSIKDIFHAMMQDPRVDQRKPCIEWYKSDEEMFCMIKML